MNMVGESRDPLSKSFILRAGWLIDGTGDSTKKDICLGISNGKIVSRGSFENHKDKSNQETIIDYSGHTVIPCLVDCHVHLFMSGTGDASLREAQLHLSYETARKAISINLRDHLLHGVAAVRDGGDYAGHVLRYRNEDHTNEKMPVFLKSAGKGWRAQGRYGKLVGRPPLPGENLCDAILRENDDADHIKIVNSGLNSLKEFGKESAPQFNPDQLREVVNLSNSLGLKTMVHANGCEPVSQALDAGCHSIEHGFFMGTENIMKMAEKGTTWVPTAFTMKAYEESPEIQPKERDIAIKNYEHQLEQIKLAAKYGVQIATGTDSGSLGAHHGAAMCHEIGSLLEAGFSAEMAVKSATFNGAALLGLDNLLGCLAKDSHASLVVLRGDKSCLPDSLASPAAVYIKGKQVL
ncbi:amidohydrolase family protein [Thermodesulfobacteriota bacterium]